MRLQIPTNCFLLCLLIISSSDAKEPESNPTLRIVTYNIHHAQGTDGVVDYDRIARILNELKPDIVALQEVDKATKRAEGVDQAKQLAKLTKLHYAFGSSMKYSGGDYGNAILSRFPIVQSQTHRLPTENNLEPRSALVAQIRPEAELPVLTFVSTHFCHVSASTRLRQAEHVNDLVMKLAHPANTLLAGDLNARPESKPLQFLKQAGWIDAVAPNSRIDFIMYRKQRPWQVIERKIVDDLVASDHKPILVVLSLKRT